MLRLNDIVDRVQATRPGADIELIHKAYVFTAKVHHGQLRQSGEPYLIHPLNVAFVLADWNLDEETVVTGLLHDTVEDTVATAAEIKELFGDTVSQMVDGVTKISRVVISDVADQKAESLRKMILAMGKDVRVVLVKLADRLHNMRTIAHLPRDKQVSIARETQEIYIPIASRLGMSRVKMELEDLCFEVLHPEDFRELVRLTDERKRDRESHIRGVVELLERKLKEAGVEANVTGRSKHTAGVFQKMARQGIDFDHVYDFIGFRIIAKTVRDCYEALGIVHSLWKPVPGRFKDYIAMPKPNLYQSLHTTVFGPNAELMEVQIRTEEMHAIAEYGVAAHWKYKEGRPIVGKGDQMFLWLRQILELQQDMKDPREFLDTVKVELFPEEVYVFTPRGDVKELPQGATTIDFAYAIHTEVGNHCVGAKVNGKMVPLKTVLVNGDVVEIITQPSHRPSKDWLKVAKTSRALNKIRAFVRQEQQESSLALGRQILERELRKYSLSVNKVLKSKEFEEALQETRLKTADDYCISLGYGKMSLLPLLRRLVPPDQLQEKVKETRLGQLIKRVTSKRPSAVVVKGMDDIFVRLGNCCHPVPGDPIVGFITRGRGVTIHARDCPKALENDPARAIEVAWEAGSKAVHPVKLRVVCADKPGLLADISRTITASDVDIRRAVVMTTRDQRAICNFEVSVNDAQHLAALIKSIEKVKNVYSVERGKG
ncbi:MAG TPA: bifunctional (p)ppGpp synthetase/guanosine-3',5'-bis(diphosphate) 3'-pyrophosphohydrolase [Candidatus Deferrimicrobiaceae bacterium]|nr:bifunctional (p)ppGpp synthetase/guanosine-3',5'-bis(diphosphate) 3'-pyrophosphohydrolase [Candidatus Deferrimicrobiaceae bacterium]